MIRAAWWWIRLMIDLFGGLCVVCTAIVIYQNHRDEQEQRRIIGMRPPGQVAPAIEESSPAAKRLAADLAPELQSLAQQYEPTFVSHAGNAIMRYVAGRAYPVVVREIPRGTEIGCDRLLSYLGSLKVSEVIERIADHTRFKGEKLDPSFRQAFPASPFEPRALPPR